MSKNDGFSFEYDELGVCCIDYFMAEDKRGGFNKLFEKELYLENGIDFCVDEVFISSSSKNVIRGIHFQMDEPQAKIVSILSGSAYDVIVDLRKDSKYLKTWKSYLLNEKDHRALYIPPGFGHGFFALEDNTSMLYICAGKYNPISDTGIIYSDPDIGISWPIDDLSKTVHSERDLALMSYREYLEKISK